MLYLALLPPVLIGGLFDLKKGIIPNELTIMLIVSGLVYNAIAGNIIMSAIGFIVCFFIGYIAYCFEGMGGGDVKLIAGLGAWLGLQPLVYIILFSSLVGLLWFALRSLFKKGFLSQVRDYLYKLYLLRAVGIKNGVNFDKDNTVPYGTCIAIGYIITLVLGLMYPAEFCLFSV